MAAQIATVGRVVLVGPHHHGHRIPAHIGANALLVFGIAGAAGLEVGWNGIDVGGIGRERNVGSGTARLIDHLLKQEMGTLGTFTIDDRFQCIKPLGSFRWIDIARVVGGGKRIGHSRHRSSPLIDQIPL